MANESILASKISLVADLIILAQKMAQDLPVDILCIDGEILVVDLTYVF